MLLGRGNSKNTFAFPLLNASDVISKATVSSPCRQSVFTANFAPSSSNELSAIPPKRSSFCRAFAMSDSAAAEPFRRVSASPILPRLNADGFCASHFARRFCASESLKSGKSRRHWGYFSGSLSTGRNTVLPLTLNGTPPKSSPPRGSGAMCHAQCASVLNGTNVCMPVMSKLYANSPLPTCAGDFGFVLAVSTLCRSTTARLSILPAAAVAARTIAAAAKIRLINLSIRRFCKNYTSPFKNIIL